MNDLPPGFMIPKREHFQTAKDAYREIDRLRDEISRLRHHDDADQRSRAQLAISFIQPIAADLYSQEKRAGRRA